jgi:hypothetical protein
MRKHESMERFRNNISTKKSHDTNAPNTNKMNLFASQSSKNVVKFNQPGSLGAKDSLSKSRLGPSQLNNNAGVADSLVSQYSAQDDQASTKQANPITASKNINFSAANIPKKSMQTYYPLK